MNPDHAKVLFDFLYSNLQEEFDTTLKVLEAVPNQKLDYAPSERCTPALKLAGHIAQAELMFAHYVMEGGMPSTPMPEFDSPQAVVDFYKNQVKPAFEKLATLTPDQLAREVTFFKWTMPAVHLLQFLITHSAHHRGQLSTYLRPMGAKVPGIYGPSADTPMEMSA
jgi:uncharacterized damage-inducible protein DinB